MVLVTRITTLLNKKKRIAFTCDGKLRNFSNETSVVIQFTLFIYTIKPPLRTAPAIEDKFV